MVRGMNVASAEGRRIEIAVSGCKQLIPAPGPYCFGDHLPGYGCMADTLGVTITLKYGIQRFSSC